MENDRSRAMINVTTITTEDRVSDVFMISKSHDIGDIAPFLYGIITLEFSRAYICKKI